MKGEIIMTENLQSLRFAGAGTVPAGRYDAISAAGSVHINGEVYCNTLSGAGSVCGSGRLVCEQSVSTSGSMLFSGDVKCCEKFFTSGSAHIDGNIESGEIKSAGSFSAHSVSAGVVKLSGSMTISNGVECDTAKLSGGGKIGGLLNAETVEIEFNGNGKLEIADIGCSQITVTDKGTAVKRGLFGRSKLPSHLSVGTIEGESIYLESTDADTVKGTTVKIGPNCKIDYLEYSDSYECDETSQVSQATKI